MNVFSTMRVGAKRWKPKPTPLVCLTLLQEAANGWVSFETYGEFERFFSFTARASLSQRLSARSQDG